ncbi:hypothetical protein [Macrococcoides caseolyticum]|uniref:hypothetical protein n=1 Tax=Macrococcoides caseolyticum TaxID=69966 RepID=UPI000C333C85|nr:hypothetical protein [Macrococcus caseolyticus]PKE22784.1 hypothetical protein CW688_01250 [Macrococcus caseolyticus]
MGRESYSSDSKSSELSGYELEDALVYKLAHKLGGRSEIIDMPLEEALAYLIIIIEQEEQQAEAKKWELYMNHMSRINANPAHNDKESKRRYEFIETINPMKENKALEMPKELEWNFEQLEQLKVLQT